MRVRLPPRLQEFGEVAESGLLYLSRKQERSQGRRGFESLSLRCIFALMRKRYLNDSEFASFTDKELEAELKKCKIMKGVSSSAVGRKGFAKREMKVSDEIHRRAETKENSEK